MSATTAPDRTRTLLYVLGGVVVLALLWFFVISPLFLGGDDELDEPLGPVATPTAPADDLVTEEETTPEDALETLPIETYEIFLARDPFSPVVPAPAAGPTDGGADDGGTDGGTDGDGGAQPPSDADRIAVVDVEDDSSSALVRVDDVVWLVREGELFGPNLEFQVVSIDHPCLTIDGPGGQFTVCEGGQAPDGDGDDGDGDDDGDGCSGGDGEAVCDGQVVSLVDVFTEDGEERAVVQVDDRLFEVAEGDRFASNYQVLSIDPPCVTLLFGDDSFTLCEGDRVLK